MKLLKNIFGRIWALWGLLWFVGTMFVAFIFFLPCAILPDPQRTQWHRQVSRIWMLVYLHIIGCRIKIVNAQVFVEGENYVVVCNHNSLLDVPITTPFMPRANKTIAKKSFAKFPIFGWIYSWGSVLLDRNDEKSRVKSFNAMKQVLDLGLDMVLYPEGTRNKTDKPLGTFFGGAFMLSKETGKKIIPAILFNSRKALPSDKTFYLWPVTLELHFLPPVAPQEHTIKELKNIVYQQMWDYYVAHK